MFFVVLKIPPLTPNSPQVLRVLAPRSQSQSQKCHLANHDSGSVLLVGTHESTTQVFATNLFQNSYFSAVALFRRYPLGPADR
jgi:hypothetical protein